MAEDKIIVCLANSRKNNGRCVAGIEIDGEKVGNWIRPVSSSAGAAVSEIDRRFEDGTDVRVLDLVSVPTIKAVAIGHQVENWLIDPNYYWELKGRINWDDLAQFESQPAPLWPSGAPPTFVGSNDRVLQAESSNFDDSLRLIRIEDLVLEVSAPGASFGNSKRRVQGTFDYEGARYSLWVTDPVIERDYLREDDGSYLIDECYLAISLGEASNGYCYKLIASIITRDRFCW